MNTTQTLEQMRELKLTGMLHSYQSQLELSINHQLEAHELIAHLLQAENLYRSNARLITLLHAAKLRFHAIPESIECSVARNLSKAQWSLLLESSFVQQGENILITGATGCGKSHVACALGYQACLLGIKTRYFNMNRLIETVSMAKTEGSYLKFLNSLEKIPLIIIDDFGLQALNKNMKLALLQIMEDRYAKKSLIVTSQLPVANWYEYLDEPTLADAIMDRMTAKSNRIELKGESRRKKKQVA
jgi:DNA replication protein DnaC